MRRDALRFARADPCWRTVVLGAPLGAILAIACYPMWTDNVESAQVLAGVVRLPVGDVMATYHTSVRSLQIQVPALLLALGISEWPLCLASIGLQGALSFVAVALLTLVFARSVAVSLLVPVMLLVLRQWAGEWPGDVDALHGHHYPILFPAHASIFGVVGFFGMIATVALLALGKRRSALLGAGLLPGVHAAFALPTWLALAAGELATRRTLRPALPEVRWFGAGLAISVLSFTLQPFLVDTPLPVAPAGVDVDAALRAFYAHWDAHNRLLRWREVPFFFEATLYFALVSAALSLRWRAICDAMRFVLAGLATVVCVGAVLVVLRAAAPGWSPDAIRHLIAGRWLNVASIVYFCIAVGIVGGSAVRDRRVATLIGFGVVCAVVFSGRLMGLTAASVSAIAGSDRWLGPVAFLLPVAVLGSFAIALDASPTSWRVPARLQGVAVALLIAGTVAAAWHHGVARASRDAIAGRDGFEEMAVAIASGDGLLLSGDDSLRRPQLRTRRGVLLDVGQLNLIAKSPATAGPIEKILVEVYCTTLRYLETPYAPFENTYRCWSERSREAWQRIRKEFGVHHVLVPSDVHLLLDVIHRTDALTLFEVPDEPDEAQF